MSSLLLLLFPLLLLLSLSTELLCMEGHLYNNFKTDQKYAYETKYFPNQIDHFSFAQNGLFNQRYLWNDTFWDPREGPIFFYTGNEGDIEAFAQNTGFMWDLAPELNALVVFAEHRYYGKSLPFGEKSLEPNPKWNGFLSSEQALADFAALVTHIRGTVQGAEKAPVIAFGGSYGGMLAAWFRIKYPHICDGALAGSAPVAQFSAPCDAFGRIVTSDYSQIGLSCSETIRNSWKAIDNVTDNDAGLDWLSKQFHLCEPLKKEKVAPFKDYLTNLWTNVAMMDYPYPNSFLEPLPGNPVSAVCKGIMKENAKEEKDDHKKVLAKVFAGVSVYFNYTGSAKCLELADPDQIGSAMWDFQACTEMVMPMCYDGVSDMFEPTKWNYTEYAAGCKKKWLVEPRPEMASLMYGEKELAAASNIIFSNGLLDPWSSGGVLKSVSKTVVSLLIPEGAHHLDLRGADPADPPGVRKARAVEKRLIEQWVAEAGKRRSGPPNSNEIPVVVGKYFY